MVLLFLLRHYQRTGDVQSLEIVRHTCEAMARGGIYDQLAGGFARYSVDERWIVPHFEKMLYDNALLLRVYTQLWRLTGDRMARRVARQVAEFLRRDLPGFTSSLDADTNGSEGATYVWSPDQLREVLGEADGNFAADLFAVTGAGTFEHGTSVLRLARDIDDATPDLVARWEDVRTRLYAARLTRPQPARDDKVVSAWSGLAITALAEYAALVGARETALVGAVEEALAGGRDEALVGADEAAAAAVQAATLLADVHLVGGRLRRASRDGVVGQPAGVLEDYGCVAEAFCAVHQLTGERRWLDLAGGVLDAALTHFADGRGGFHDTADDAERLVARPADPTDNATASGLSSMVAALVTYSALTGHTTYREAAQRALETIEPILARHARFAGYSCAAGEALVSGPYEIAIVAPDGVGGPLAEAARRLAPPGAVIVVGEPDAPGVPLLAERSLIGGLPSAYVCRGFVCDRPVTSVEDLTAQLTGSRSARS
jgi:uncharacterized protein YyaL (SSP411 family)